ncbi:MAG: mucoidy inhibitor MuiA family protein [Kofleriaceae bacterium]
MIAADVPVVAVTVFEDRARVTRRATVEVPAGASRIVVAGVAPVVADKTVVARARGAEVVDARVRRTTAPWRDGGADPRSAVEALAELDRALAAARRDAAAHATAAALAAAAAATLARLVTRSCSELAAAAARGQAPVDAAAALERLTSDAVAARRDAARAEVAAARAASVCADLAARQAALADGAIRRVATIELDVSAAAAAAVELELAYVVPGACWRPYHTATWAADVLELATDACVWQATGEDWRDVALTCSTARPSLGAAPPVPVDDRLRVVPRGAVIAAAREQAIATTGLGGGAPPLAEVPGVDDGGRPARLVAPGPATILGDGQPHRIRLGAWTTPVEAAHVAFPERTAGVVVRTRAIHAGSTPLLAGPVDLIRDGGATGRTSILYVAVGERFELGWGADPALRVHRVHRERTEDAGLLGTWRATRHRVAIRLSNLGPTARTVTVTERIPVSELADKVEIELRPVDAWQLEDDDGARRDRTPRVTARTERADGMIEWQVELPPRQRRAIAHEYVVKIHGSAVAP